MDGNHAPRSLHEELHEEARGRETSFAAGEDPGRDECGAHECGADHGPTTSHELREVSNNAATGTCASFHEDTPTASGGVLELFLRQEKGGVAVLGGVAVVIEPGHEDDAVNTHLPLAGQHYSCLLPEGSWGNFGLA